MNGKQKAPYGLR